MSNNWKPQKQFSQQEIIDRLQGFTHMVEHKQLKAGMHLRYISPDKGTKKRTLKMGGILVYIDPQKRFLRLKSMIPGSTKPWSVQLNENVEIYFKEMKKQDQKYQEVVKWAGSENNLSIIQKVLGESKDAQKNIKHIMKHFSGNLTNLINTNVKNMKQLNQANKRIQYLEAKLTKGKKKTGMKMLSESK